MSLGIPLDGTNGAEATGADPPARKAVNGSGLAGGDSAGHGRPLSVLQLGMAWFAEQPGGLDRYYADLFAHAARAGLDARGLVTGSADVGRLSGGRVTAYAPANALLLRRWRACRAAVAAAVADRPVDLWASHLALYAFPVLRQMRRLPHVVHFHGPFAAEGAREGQRSIRVRLKGLVERPVYRSADRLIVLSEAFRAVLCGDYGVDPERVRVIPGGVDVGRFDLPATRPEARAQLGWPGDRPIVLCVRRLIRRMGLHDLIVAVDRVRRRCPDVLCLIGGRGPIEPELRVAIEGMGLGDHVRLLGFVPDEQLPLAYRAADLSVVPTEAWEGFGLTAAESLAAGTPVLVTPVGGLPEVVGDLSRSLVLAGVGAAAVAEGLVGALTGRLTLPTSEACAVYAAERFDWAVVARRIKDVYVEAVEAFHGGARA